MVLIDSLDAEWPWAFAYCKVEIGPPLTEGTGAFHISVPTPLPAGRIWLTRFGTYPDLTGVPYLVFDLIESEHKIWEVNLKDGADNTYRFRVEEANGHLVVPLSEIPTGTIDLANIKEISMGAIAPLDVTYAAILDYMRTETEIPPPLPPTPLTISVKPESAALMIGETQQFTATVFGGTSPYAVQWIDNVTKEVIGTGEIVSYTATEIGSFEIFARATDNVGDVADSNVVNIKVTEAPPPPPPEEPTPPNTSHISVVGRNVEPLHVGMWYPWFLDTSSGWLPAVGERWEDGNYTIWNPERLRAILKDIRDVFKCNMIRVFFWMDWYLTNSNATMSNLYPESEIGNADALHALCQIALEEGLDVELRMWSWNPTEGRNSNPLATHTKAEFINAWVQFATDFSQYPNVCFNLFDETTIDFATWKDLAYDTIMQIRNAGVGHVIYVHYLFCGGEGIGWIRSFGNHYQVAFSRHEYISHGTTEAMHQDTINIHNEGYPVTMTASGVQYEDATQTEPYRRWYTELLNNNIGIGFYTYGRPNIMSFRIQQDTPFPCPPNSVGNMWIEVTAGVAPPPPTPPIPKNVLVIGGPLTVGLIFLWLSLG